MKLKEWGIMRHKGRKTRLNPRKASSSGHGDSVQERRALSGTAEPTSIEPESLEHREKTGIWQTVESAELANAEPTFMGLLNQTTKYVMHITSLLYAN